MNITTTISKVANQEDNIAETQDCYYLTLSFPLLFHFKIFSLLGTDYLLSRTFSIFNRCLAKRNVKIIQQLRIVHTQKRRKKEERVTYYHIERQVLLTSLEIKKMSF